MEYPSVPKHKSGLPKRYVGKLSDTTASERKSHWEKTEKMSSKDPKAYEPAPGDKTAKTKESQYTRKYKQMYGEESEITEEIAALRNKADKSGVSYGLLKRVYDRGMAAWKTGHRPGTTPQQWALARTNSYLTKGKTYHTTDKDLREMNQIDEISDKTKADYISAASTDAAKKAMSYGAKGDAGSFRKMSKRLDTIQKVARSLVKKEESENIDEMKTVTNRSRSKGNKINIGGMDHSYRSYDFGLYHPSFGPLKDEKYKSKAEMKAAMEKHPTYNPTLKEEVAANAVGGGKIAGVGIGPQGEPPGKVAVLAKALSMIKRKNPNA